MAIEPRVLLVVMPAAVMAGGVTIIGICMIFPQVFGWTYGVLVVLAVIELIRITRVSYSQGKMGVRNPKDDGGNRRLS